MRSMRSWSCEVEKITTDFEYYFGVEDDPYNANVPNWDTPSMNKCNKKINRYNKLIENFKESQYSQHPSNLHQTLQRVAMSSGLIFTITTLNEYSISITRQVKNEKSDKMEKSEIK